MNGRFGARRWVNEENRCDVRKVALLVFKSVPLLEDIQPISCGMGNDHALLQGSPLTTFA